MCQPQHSSWCQTSNFASPDCNLVTYQWSWFQVHGKGTKTLNLTACCCEFSFSWGNLGWSWPQLSVPFPGLGGGEGQWPRGVHGVYGVLGSGAGSAGQCHSCSTLSGLGQITQRCLEITRQVSMVLLPTWTTASKLKREMTRTASVSIYQTLIWPVERSRKDAGASTIDSSH